MHLSSNHKLFAGFFVYILLQSCGATPPGKQYGNSADYDYARPKILNLPQVLDEISGIAYYPKDTSVFAIVDEDGLLYKISLKEPKRIREWAFDKPRDYEDLVMIDSTFYVLTAKGAIVKVLFDGDKIRTEKFDFPDSSGAKNELEILYFDPTDSLIKSICKDCKADGKMTLSTFVFNPRTNIYAYGPVLNTAMIREKAPAIKGRIKPSAAAIHPVTKDLYIVSSTDKMIAVYGPDLNLKEVIELNPRIYKQPEGISFTPAGNLIISNEVYLEGYAQLLLLKYKKIS